MANGTFKLLETFRTTFAGTVYKHRNSTLGNKIGRQLFEDLLGHDVSRLYREHVEQGSGVVNSGGRIHTPRTIRRNDSAFGKPPAGARRQPPPAAFAVPEGPVAEPRLGCEVKIIAKSQQKQIDRVTSDLENFALRMKSLSDRAINVAVVGINQESDYVGHEGERAFKHRLREQEPTATMARLRAHLLDRHDCCCPSGRPTSHPIRSCGPMRTWRNWTTERPSPGSGTSTREGSADPFRSVVDVACPSHNRRV